MKVKIIKPHHKYSGVVDVSDERANYLIRVGAAEEHDKPKKKAAPKKKK